MFSHLPDLYFSSNGNLAGIDLAAFVGNGQFLAAFFSSSFNNVTAIGSCHSFKKSVFVSSFSLRWLKCSFCHDNYLLNFGSAKIAYLFLNQNTL